MKLDVRLIVPGPDAGTVLLNRLGALPVADADGADDESAIVAVDRLLHEGWRLTAPVLETHARWAGVPEGEPIPCLVTTEPAAADWMPLDGLLFRPVVAAAAAGLPDILVARADELLGALRRDAPPPELRPRWARRGWHGRAATWMGRALAEAGRPLLDAPRPFFLRGISALLRGRTADGDVFLKAVFPPFHPEPVATRLLAERFPGAVPGVIAIDADEGWLLIDDVAAPWVLNLPAHRKAAGLRAGARALVGIQRALADDHATFTAAGCPTRPLDPLAELLDAALGPDGVAMVDAVVSADRRSRAVAATRSAVERVVALGFPTTVVHGDFHSGNVAIAGDRAVIIDWSDAAIANPAIDLVTWLAWSKDEPEIRQAAIDAWVDAWAGPIDPAAVRAAVGDILIVGAAYQVVSYDGIVRALEPATRYTMAGGAKHFLEELEARLGSAAAVRTPRSP